MFILYYGHEISLAAVASTEGFALQCFNFDLVPCSAGVDPISDCYLFLQHCLKLNACNTGPWTFTIIHKRVGIKLSNKINEQLI